MDQGAILYRSYIGGDDEAMVELIRIYKDGLMLYLNGITSDLSLAEEFMEDTFFRLAAKRPKYSGKSSFKTWLYTIGRNAALDSLRKRKFISETPVEERYDLSDERDLEREYLREEQKVALHQAMETLNSDYRQVLYLTFFEEMSNAEAAAVMKKSRRQIENLLYRAKLALKTTLEKEGFEYEGL